MQIIMGGSGSTGSSLLKNILNRHPDVFSGGETAFFAKEMIYNDWQNAKSRVLKRKFFGLRNYGWHIYNGTDLLQDEYLWNKKDLEKAFIDSPTLQEFASTFYKKAMDANSASIWLEKTPANSACFSFFLDSFEKGKAIHMVRNPYDTIASLVSRGFDLYYAVGIYLLNTASGLNKSFPNRIHTVKYEELTDRPESTVKNICKFLEITFDSSMLQPKGEIIENSQLKGWQYDETKAIGKGSVGRFNKLSEDSQQEIIEAVNSIRINNRGKEYYNTQLDNIEQICGLLDYDFHKTNMNSSFKTLSKLKLKDQFTRIRRGYPTGFNYPLNIQR